MGKGKHARNKSGSTNQATSRGTNAGASTGLRKSTEMRSDMTTAPSNKNPFPKGLA